MKKKLIKVCGMMQSENIKAVERLGIDMMGFIFYHKSPRNVIEKPNYLPITIDRVGVFVDAELDFIKDKITDFDLTIVQLHGSESPERCRDVTNIGVKVIKAFSVATIYDIAITDSYQDCCDYILFDTKSEQKGGSGVQFDWAILEHYKGIKPFLLSGGISIDSVSSLNQIDNPKLIGYDLNSKFEEYPAYKKVKELELFIKQIEK